MSGKNSLVSDRLSLTSWQYTRFFLPSDVQMHSVVEEIEAYIERRDLASHEFFIVAGRDRRALELWLSQELVMTNAFSQIVLSAASLEQNVHVRAILVEVAAGEHGHVTKGLAKRAHPWLLHKLGESVGLTMDAISPMSPTISLIRRLDEKSRESTLAALAWIGVGNERLILPEYKAVKSCFSQIWSDADYEPFLQANLTEDKVHSRLCYQAASILIAGDQAQADDYYTEAVASIEARWNYFDELLEISTH